MSPLLMESQSPSPTLHEPPIFMRGLSRFPRYCESNDGYIDVINGASDNEEHAKVIVGLNERKKRTAKAKGERKARKSNGSEQSQGSKVELPAKTRTPVLPTAPINPVIPATLSFRLKSRHHPGGWHARTVMESKAAEMLLSKTDSNVGDLTSITANVVGNASQSTLRLIAEHDDKTIEGALRAVVKQFNLGDNAYKIRHEWFEISEKSDGKGKVGEKTLSGSVSRAELQHVLAVVEKNLAESPVEEYLPDGLGEVIQAKRGDIDFEMDMEYET